MSFRNLGSNGFEPLKAKSQQIYSLSPLAARATPRIGQDPQGPAEAALALNAQVRKNMSKIEPLPPNPPQQKRAGGGI